MKQILLLGAACAFVAGCAHAPQQPQQSNCIEKSALEVVMVMHRSLKAECVAAYKEAFAQCQEATLQEPGCLDYALYQSPKDSTEFLLYENWENDSVLALHGKTAHLKAFLQTTKEMFTAKKNKKVYVCPE